MIVKDDNGEEWAVRESLVNVVGLGNLNDGANNPRVCLSLMLGETQVNFGVFHKMETAREAARRLGEVAGL